MYEAVRRPSVISQSFITDEAVLAKQKKKTKIKLKIKSVQKGATHMNDRD